MCRRCLAPTRLVWRADERMMQMAYIIHFGSIEMAYYLRGIYPVKCPQTSAKVKMYLICDALEQSLCCLSTYKHIVCLQFCFLLLLLCLRLFSSASVTFKRLVCRVRLSVFNSHSYFFLFFCCASILFAFDTVRKCVCSVLTAIRWEWLHKMTGQSLIITWTFAAYLYLFCARCNKWRLPETVAVSRKFAVYGTKDYNAEFCEWSGLTYYDPRWVMAIFLLEDLAAITNSASIEMC